MLQDHRLGLPPAPAVQITAARECVSVRMAACWRTRLCAAPPAPAVQITACSCVAEAQDSAAGKKL